MARSSESIQNQIDAFEEALAARTASGGVITVVVGEAQRQYESLTECYNVLDRLYRQLSQAKNRESGKGCAIRFTTWVDEP